MGFDHSDDAGVFQLTPDLAIVQTLDFITPVVNDPYQFGQIAAANSLSDIFAMGGKVATALNIVAYDNCHVSKEMLQEILAGGLDKLIEAGGTLLGGHTITDLEMKYGMSVTGTVHPKKVIRNHTTCEGDAIILTKPIGLGVLSTALKADMTTPAEEKEIADVMKLLNMNASQIALDHDVHAMTDVTGFGLFGHLSEMLNNKMSIHVQYDSIPFIKSCFSYAELGLFPGGSNRNRDYFSRFVDFSIEYLASEKIMLCFDAQTSGGLLISLPENQVKSVLLKLHDAGYEMATVIGYVEKSCEKKVVVE